MKHVVFRLDPRVNELEQILRGDLRIRGTYTGPVIRLNKPNLTCFQVELFLIGTDLHITVFVHNSGALRAPQCDILAIVNIMPTPRNTDVRIVPPLHVVCPALDPGFAVQLEFPVVAEVNQGDFASATIVIDPLGQVPESNKSDNICTNAVMLEVSSAPDGPSVPDDPRMPGHS